MHSQTCQWHLWGGYRGHQPRVDPLHTVTVLHRDSCQGEQPQAVWSTLFFFLLSDHSRWPARGLQDGQFYFLLYSSYCQKLCSGLYQLLPSRIGFGSLFPTSTEGHVVRIIKIYPDLWYTIEARPNGYSPGPRHAAVVRE